MKKTIIAILALSGVALAVDAPATIDGKTFNKDLLYYLNNDPYEGGAFTIHFKIDQADSFGNQRGFITFGTDDKALQAWSQSGTYVGLTTTDDPHSWATSTNNAGVNTFVFDGAPNSWISKNATGQNAAPGVNGSDWTIFYNGNGTTEISVVFGDATEDITIKNYAMDLTQFSVLGAAATESGPRLSAISEAYVIYNGLTSHNLMVPEPATATLSLLALAGLASRLRRH